MVKVTPIPLYRNLGGRSLFDRDDPKFREYRQRWEYQPLNFEAGDFPLFLDVEVTNMCNLRCTFCATTYLSKNIKRQLIDPDLVFKIMEEGRDNGLYGLKFNDRGEPLLHPQLVEFIKYAKQCGFIDVYFNTNAMLLDESMAIKLIESGLDRISISIEGTSAEIYERYRVGGRFAKVLENVRRLWQLRQEMGRLNPLIRIQSVLLPEISGQLEEYRLFWGPYADEISVIEYKEEKDSGLRLKGAAFPWACNQLWQRMVIWCDGRILPCNEDDCGLLSLGRYPDMSLKDAWNGEGLTRLRARHREGKAHLLPACDGCYLRDTQIKKLSRG
jgi:MoaA/NifB/PqqE/SkfB family radical SAM enzyme